MKKRRLIIIGVIFVLLFSSIAGYAQEKQEKTSTQEEDIDLALKKSSDVSLFKSAKNKQEAILTQEEAIDLALQQNSEIIKLQQELQAVQAEIRGAEASFYPKVDLSSNYTRLEEAPTTRNGPGSKDNYTFKIGLQQPIYAGGRITATYEQIKNKLQITKMNLKQKKQELAYQVTQQYYNVLKAKKMVKVNETAVERINRYLEVARANQEVGTATNTEVLRAKVNHTQAKQGLLKAKNRLELAKMALKNTLNLAENVELKLNDKLNWQEKEFDLEKTKSYAFAHRSELQLLDLQRKSLQFNLKQVNGQKLPSLNLMADYTSQEDQLKVSEGEWKVTLALNYNLFDGGKVEADSDQLKRKMDKLDVSKKQLKDKISLEVREGLLNLKEAKERIELMKLNLQQANDNLEEMELRYEEGIITSLDILEAQSTHQEVKTDYFQAIYDYNLAVAKLNKIMGRPVTKGGQDQ